MLVEGFNYNEVCMYDKAIWKPIIFQPKEKKSIRLDKRTQVSLGLVVVLLLLLLFFCLCCCHGVGDNTYGERGKAKKKGEVRREEEEKKHV